MKKLFGTDGIRGHAGEFPLDEKTVRIVGASLARQCRERLGRTPRFVSGRDTRESGAAIERAFHAGAIGEGAECLSAGVITTPGVAYLTRTHDFDAGIVISASHNPYQDNGIKIFTPSGRKSDEETERTIERDIHEGREAASATENFDDPRAAEFQDDYLDYLSEQHSSLDLSGMKIAVDCANGAASKLAPELFKRFGADLIAMNCTPDGRNINLDCGSLHLEHLQARVLEEKTDFGVAFDGDADRALFVDEKGNIVDGDATLWIMARHLLRHEKLANKKVVATVMSNIGLEIALRDRDIELVRTNVGDKYVLDELLQSGSEIGGEQSGHIIFPEKSLVGDGMMTALFILDAIREQGSKFSEMANGFVRYPQVLVNVKVREKQPFDQVANIVSAAREIEEKLSGSGRLLLRYSGTENLARVMIEGRDQAEIDGMARGLGKVIEASIG